MKTGPFTPKPGELFQWHYDIDDSICQPDDKLWAKSPYRWIPCVDNSNLLVALTATDIWWVNSQGFIHTYVDCLQYRGGRDQAATENVYHPRIVEI